jgi:hypothetical protein
LEALAWGGGGAIASMGLTLAAVEMAGVAGLGLQQVGLWTGNATLLNWGLGASAAGGSAWLWLTTGRRWSFVGYHGTSSAYVPSIRKGINPPTGLNFGGESQLGEGFYITPDFQMANDFAQNAAQSGGSPTTLRIYAQNLSQMSGAQVPEQHWWSNPFPNTYVTNYDYLTSPISGFEPVMQTKFNSGAYDSIRAHLSWFERLLMRR